MVSEQPIYIVSAQRSAIGTFGGTLKNTSAADILTPVMHHAIAKSGIAAEAIDTTVLGNVIHTSSIDPYLARKCSVDAGISHNATAYAINRLCGSSLQAIINVIMAIRLGDSDIGLAAGVEHMSGAPHILPDLRFGPKMGNSTTTDMLLAPLTDPFGHGHMGITAENVAKKFDISRDEMDRFAAESHRRTAVATDNGFFADQITPLTLKARRKEVIFDTDEHFRRDADAKQLGELRPVFDANGIVTAGNSSGINDGAAAVMLAREDAMKSSGAKPLARIVAYGHSGVDPAIMGIGPVSASQQAVARANIGINDLDVIESNEAFAAQACAVSKELGLDPAKVNPNGGAIALGHPIGATGAIIVTKLVHELHRIDGRYGLATMCIGGGQGVALIVERV